MFGVADGGEKIVAKALETGVIHCHSNLVSSVARALSIISIPRQVPDARSCRSCFGARYCFTAPNVRPVTMCRWASRATSSTGSVMSVAAAASVPQLISSYEIMV